MITKLILCAFLVITITNAATTQEGALYKEKQELIAVKDELNEFYEIKELEYQENKMILEELQKKIEIAEQTIQETQKANQEILDEINRVITSKAMIMYDKMKLSVAVEVFNEMIDNGEIDEVFDIMIRMKEDRVIKILKKFDTTTSTILMKKMRILKDTNIK